MPTGDDIPMLVTGARASKAGRTLTSRECPNGDSSHRLY
jgi:hypothetical protein